MTAHTHRENKHNANILGSQTCWGQVLIYNNFCNLDEWHIRHGYPAPLGESTGIVSQITVRGNARDVIFCGNKNCTDSFEVSRAQSGQGIGSTLRR